MVIPILGMEKKHFTSKSSPNCAPSPFGEGWGEVVSAIEKYAIDNGQ